MKPAAPESTAPITKPIATSRAEQQPEADEDDDADDGDGQVLAAEIGLRALGTAAEISCILAEPASAAITWLTVTPPYTSANMPLRENQPQ